MNELAIRPRFSVNPPTLPTVVSNKADCQPHCSCPSCKEEFLKKENPLETPEPQDVSREVSRIDIVPMHYNIDTSDSDLEVSEGLDDFGE